MAGFGPTGGALAAALARRLPTQLPSSNSLARSALAGAGIFTTVRSRPMRVRACVQAPSAAFRAMRSFARLAQQCDASPDPQHEIFLFHSCLPAQVVLSEGTVSVLVSATLTFNAADDARIAVYALTVRIERSKGEKISR